MLTPRIITDVKESWDQDGNIKREMTHYIENIDGTKHTKKETVVIPAHTDTEHPTTTRDEDDDNDDIDIISLDDAGDMIAASGAHLARMNQPKQHEDGGCYASDDGRSLDDDDLFDPPPGDREKHPLLAAAKKGAAALSASAAALQAQAEHDAAANTAPPAGGERRNSVQNLTTQEFHKQRLMAFYHKHNPSKLSTVTATLEKYVGREELVLEKLEHKYGDNPTHVWLTSYYTEHNPTKLSEVEATLEKYAGREEELFRKLEQKYAGSGSREKKNVVPETTPPATTTQTEHQARVEREIQQLVHDIGRIGNPQEPWCTFGDLFDDETVANYYEALVGTLKAAKKRNLIEYPGQFLLKGVNDAVVIRIRE